MTFFSQADRGEESVHYDLFPPDRQRLCRVTNASPPHLQFSPFAVRIPLEIPLPRPNPGAFQFRPHGLWELLLPTPLKKAGPVNSPPEARPVFCAVAASLISAAARQTLPCVLRCPPHGGSRVSAPRPTRWGERRRETIHLPSRTCQQRVLPPSCGPPLSPPVFRISPEAAAQMNKNHCPCHLPWDRPPLLNENEEDTGQLSLP